MGGSFLYLENFYPTLISQDTDINKDNVVFEGDKLHVYVKQQEERIKQALKPLYILQCKALVEKRIQYLSNLN